MKKIILLATFCLSLPLSAALTPVEKDKILFMVFENQNKKIITREQPPCKKGSTEWACVNSTAKTFLMNLLRVNEPQGFTQTTDVICEPISMESLKNLNSDSTAQFWSTDFQREVKQSLKGQWVCRLEVVQADAQNWKLGLAFIMNRDKSRIVSRKFSAWKVIQNM